MEFDNYKDRIAEIKENELDKKNTNVVNEKNTPNKEKFNTVLTALYDLYKNFIGLFK